MQFSIGFRYGKFRYGWLKNELYRLPDEVDGRNYSLKKIPQISLPGNGKGYRLCGDKISLKRVAELNKQVQWVVTAVTGEDFTLMMEEEG